MYAGVVWRDVYIAMDVRWGCLEACVHRLGLFGGMQARRDRNQGNP